MFLSYVDQRHADRDTHRDIHIRRPNAKKWDFRIQGTSKRVNPSKSPFRKFDLKTIHSLRIGKRKLKVDAKND